MNMKLLIISLVLCLTLAALCACGNKEVTPTETTDITTPAVTDPSAESTTGPAAEPTDKGLFVTEPIDPLLTMPSGFQGIELPEDEFGEDVTGVFESHPVTEPVETEPQDTNPAESESEATDEEPETPTPTVFHPDILPEDVFED